MPYEVIKTINGRRYRYLQETYRENGKVRTRNRYVGPVAPVRRKATTAERIIEKGVSTAASMTVSAVETTAQVVQKGLDGLLGEVARTERDMRKTVNTAIPRPMGIIKELVRKGQPDDELPEQLVAEPESETQSEGEPDQGSP